MVYNYEKVDQKLLVPQIEDQLLAKRKANWKGFTSKYKKGLLKLYTEHAQSPMKGAYME